MKCEQVKELILTDYLDGQMEKVQKTQLEEHLTTCRDCREYNLLTRTAVVEPFYNIEKHNPPEATWNKIREQIYVEKPLQNNSIADLFNRAKKLFYFPKSAFAAATVIVLFAVAATVIKFPTENQEIGKGVSDNQVECINYLMSVFDEELINGDDDLETSIEDFFL
ncbi:transmembrane transcriptional regulator [Candidatus Scalindua japonica]|uniref:Transmembrane transcriptional regulator n=1 Tax=Candidatus Scalindua japonica TaxID=1284222 RepID=A0A286TYM0_9BACT|nr:zf-HC2 domain-containing protein [Candidatus Scalindua japonica]GAX60964.1 transmembrane transcriptional regulator [Candidatus Scalindua japonica]